MWKLVFAMLFCLLGFEVWRCAERLEKGHAVLMTTRLNLLFDPEAARIAYCKDDAVAAMPCRFELTWLSNGRWRSACDGELYTHRTSRYWRMEYGCEIPFLSMAPKVLKLRQIVFR